MKESLHHYVVYDRLSGRILFGFTAVNDTLAVRDALSTLQVPLKDCELYCVADIFSEYDSHATEVLFGTDFKFVQVEPRHVSWSCYKFPETASEALSPLGLKDSELSELVKKHESAFSEDK